MAIDYDAIAAAGGFGKGTPRKLAKAKRLNEREGIDEGENAKVRERSGGRCELVELHPNAWSKYSFTMTRCKKRAIHIHHMLGGHGVRGRGKSALAENKLHLCPDCHSDIHAHVLIQIAQGNEWKRRVMPKRKSGGDHQAERDA